MVTGANAGDIVKFSAFTGTVGAANGSVTAQGALTAETTTSLTLADNTFHVVTGTYTAGTGFVGATGGADAMIVYDGNTAVGTQAHEAIILVGMGGTHTYTLVALAGAGNTYITLG